MGMDERYNAYTAQNEEGIAGELRGSFDSDVEDNKGVVYYTGTFEEESIQTIFYFVL